MGQFRLQKLGEQIREEIASMLLKHETGASRIAKAHSDYSKAASATVYP